MSLIKTTLAVNLMKLNKYSPAGTQITANEILSL